MGKGSGYGLVSAPPLQQTASMKVYVVTGCPNASEAADCSGSEPHISQLHDSEAYFLSLKHRLMESGVGFVEWNVRARG